MMMLQKLKVKKGDKVQVLTGKFKGQQGEILKVMPANRRVIVQGVNVVKRHTRPTQFDAGGIKEKELPVDVSNVAIVDPKDNKPTRVGYKFLNNGRKVRIARRSGEELD